MALVNERNWQKNKESIRRQEQAEAERKRRERKAKLEAASGAATPVERVKTLRRSDTPTSR